eukprot:8369126-Alexandrium_andersonii.AAC.1
MAAAIATAALARGSMLLSTLSKRGIVVGAAVVCDLCRASTVSAAALPKSLLARKQTAQQAAMQKVHWARPPCEATSHASLLALAPVRLPLVERYHAGEARCSSVPTFRQRR